MATARKMAALGRRGGLRGGVARARSLTAARRAAIASQAARVRWSKPALVIDRSPTDHGELLSFIAHYGSRVAKGPGIHDLEAIAPLWPACCPCFCGAFETASRSEEVNLEDVLRRALARAGVVLGYAHVCRRKGCGHEEQTADATERRCPTHGMRLWPKPATVRSGSTT
jgi:hypothetical protein